jgi:hypothetical protein
VPCSSFLQVPGASLARAAPQLQAREAESDRHIAGNNRIRAGLKPD